MFQKNVKKAYDYDLESLCISSPSGKLELRIKNLLLFGSNRFNPKDVQPFPCCHHNRNLLFQGLEEGSRARFIWSPKPQPQPITTPPLSTSDTLTTPTDFGELILVTVETTTTTEETSEKMARVQSRTSQMGGLNHESDPDFHHRVRNVPSVRSTDVVNANVPGAGTDDLANQNVEMMNGTPAGASGFIPRRHPDRGQWPASKAFMIIAAIFCISLMVLIGIYTHFPQMDESDHKHFKLPSSIQEASQVAKVLNHYTDEHYFTVMSGIAVLYIFLQTFAIPGSIFLSVMCGCLFNWMVALLLICFCSATGATCCYLISYGIGRGLVRKVSPRRLEQWAKGVQDHRDNIFHYMVFLRITPFLPNWFINIAAPVVDVPILPFYLGTFFGVVIPSLLAIHTGTMLHEYAISGAEVISYLQLAILGVFGFLALVPVMFKSWLRAKIE